MTHPGFTHFVVYHADGYEDAVIAGFISMDDAWAFKELQTANVNHYSYVIDESGNKVGQ